MTSNSNYESRFGSKGQLVIFDLLRYMHVKMTVVGNLLESQCCSILLIPS